MAASPIDELDYIVKLILTILFDPLVMGINRILRGNVLMGVIWIITGGIFGIGYIIDIITMITKKDITFLA
jgi:tryptophan-rich sensory protein